MNNLNTKQVNPGNGVDFSKIRKLSKGAVLKYQNTPAPLQYLWDPFYGQFQNNSMSSMNSRTSIPWNRRFAPNEMYKTVKELEKSKHYTDFTDYVLSNSNNEQVIQYLKHLDSQARRSGASEGLLYTDGNQTQLREGWDKEYTRLRNDGKYGYFHLTPQEKIDPVTPGITPLIPPPPTPPQPEIPEDTPEEGDTPGTYTTTEYLPKYRPGIWTDGIHLAGIYANNMIGAARNYNLRMKQRVPLQQASQKHAIVTDGYAERQANEQALQEARAKNTAAANATSSAENAALLQQNFEATVGMPNEQRNNQIQANEFASTTKEVQNVANENNAVRTAVANANHQDLVADFNDKLLARRGLNAKKTAETADLMNKLDASLNKFNLQEKQNMQAYNAAVNNYMYNKGVTSALNEYNDILENGHLQADYEGLMDNLLAGNDKRISTEDLQSLQDNYGDFSKTKAILSRYAKDNPEITAFLTEVEEIKNQAEQNYYNKYQTLQQQKSYADLFQKQYLGSYPSFTRDYLTTNWTTLFPQSYKKGGKVNDRFLEYIKHNRQVMKDTDDMRKHTETLAHKKLIRDLDALDRETLLLLRSIFK